MHKAVLTSLVGLMLLASGSANALSLNCQRTVESHDAFSTIQAFESWFPKTIRPTKADQIPTSKDTQVRFQINGAIYDLTPSKWMLGRLPEKGGRKSVTGVRYKCNASSAQVKLALRKNSESSSGSSQVATADIEKRFRSFSNTAICYAATNGGRWEPGNNYLPHVLEAKRRGLTCGVRDDKTDIASAAIHGIYSKSDKAICKFAKQIASKSKRVIYQAEAKRRGLTCGVAEDALTNVAAGTLCRSATMDGKWEIRSIYQPHVLEAKRRGLTCGVGESGSVRTASAPKSSLKPKTNNVGGLYANRSDAYVCQNYSISNLANAEAKRRGLTCDSGSVRTASAPKSSLKPKTNNVGGLYANRSDAYVCQNYSISNLANAEAKKRGLNCLGGNKEEIICLNGWSERDSIKRGLICEINDYNKGNRANAYANSTNERVCLHLDVDVAAREEANFRNLDCETQTATVNVGNHFGSISNKAICNSATMNGQWERRNPYLPHVAEAKRRGLTCGVGDSDSVQTAAAPKPIVSSAELTAAQKEAQRLREELAALKAKQEKQQATISADNQVPLITIISSSSNGPQGRISGRVTDNTGVGEVRVDGQLVPLDGNGNFAAKTYVPEGGISIIVEAFDLAGLSSSMSVRLNRDVVQTASITFDRLNPLGKRVKANRDALALIVGVADYENTPAKAIFADSDALMFRDYASEKLGIPANRITTLVDDGADERHLLLSVKNWLSRAVKQDRSDVYVFFAGHGLASDDGEKMYLLPYDGAPELLDDTAIARERLFNDIAAANPRSVTVFLDTCYSGTTRGPDMLIASRPIAIRAKESAIPEGFTVMTAAAGDQTAKPLEEAKHGMFSYFLMKGMEGDADANQDNQITAGELHAYVQQNVIQQSSGSQTPELQGDADRVLVRFQ